MKKVADHVLVGGVVTRLPKTVAKHSLDQIQEMVGGYVEHALGRGRTEIWCNENGIMEGLAYNHIASERTGHHVLGNAIVEYWE